MVHVTHHGGFTSLLKQVVVEVGRRLIVARELLVLLLDIGTQLQAALVLTNLPLNVALLRGFFFQDGIILVHLRAQLLNFRSVRSRGSRRVRRRGTLRRGHFLLQIGDTLAQSDDVGMIFRIFREEGRKLALHVGQLLLS